MHPELIERYNQLVSQAQSNDELYGPEDPLPTPGAHHYTIAAGPVPGDTTGRQWKLTVGIGTVNDVLTSITYLRNNDPRGWVMPPAYGMIPEMIQLYGSNFTLVDRPLAEKPDAPWLLVTAPAPGASPTDLGDFILVTPLFRPLALRGAAMWNNDLYSAQVFVTAQPTATYSFALNNIQMPPPTVNTRFRIWAAQMPGPNADISEGGYWKLADLWLVRDPNGVNRDQLLIHQSSNWSLWNLNVEPQGLGNIDTTQPAGGIIQLLVNQELAGIAATNESAAVSAFWSAF